MEHAPVLFGACSAKLTYLTVMENSSYEGRGIKKLKNMSINIIKVTPNCKEILLHYQIADFHFQYPRKTFKTASI